MPIWYRAVLTSLVWAAFVHLASQQAVIRAADGIEKTRCAVCDTTTTLHQAAADLLAVHWNLHRANTPQI
eukprot:12611-Heterococcus_DN1.PRE.2